MKLCHCKTLHNLSEDALIYLAIHLLYILHLNDLKFELWDDVRLVFLFFVFFTFNKESSQWSF